MKMLKLVLFLLCFCATIMTKAQTKKETVTKQPEMTQFDDQEERKGVKFNVIPGPMYDPSIKFGLFVAPMLAYYPSNNDLISPASTSSVYAMYTTNNSYIVGLNNELFLNKDTWRIRFRGGGGGLNKDLTLNDIDENNNLIEGRITEADAKQKVFQVEAYGMRKIIPNFYGGLGFNYKKISFEGNDDRADQLLAANNLGGSSGNFGLIFKLDYDTRDNPQYPYSGYYVGYNGYQYFKSDGKDNSYYNNAITLLGFWSLTEDHRHIIAAKLYGNFLSGDPEASNFSYYGRINGDVQRGYQSGRRVDKNATNIEVEYRWTTPLLDNRIRFAGLLGNGRVFGEYDDFSDAEWLPVAGVGVRYAILPYERINIRFDVTYSKDDFIWYFGIREAF